MSRHLRGPRSYDWLSAVAGALLGMTAFLGCKDKPNEDSGTKESPAITEATNRMTSSDNLMKLAIAMHDYHDAHQTLPPHASYSKDGKPLLSWRVLILPYIKQEKLYEQFKLDEPWDGPNNKKLLDQMPKLYAAPGVQEKEAGMTRYQVFVTEPMSRFRSLFSRPPTPGQPPPKLGLGPITSMDGTANTIMIIEAGNSVPWTKPDDLVYDEKKPLPPLGFFSNRINAAFADGSVRQLKKDPDEKALRVTITYNDGEIPKEDIFLKGLFEK